MSTAETNAAGKPGRKAPAGERVADWADGRLGIYSLAKANMRKIFPDHWSFMLGEVCLYSFLIIILTGVYLTLFFHPSMNEVVYHGSYVPLQGQRMSEAFSSTLHISFDVRGGLLIRQIHHWAALIFLAGMFVHMMRVFFTGAFRKPREINWMFGFLLFFLGMFTGFTGYSLPDDLLSGTGVRFVDGAILSVPVIGTYLSMFVFGGEFPGGDFVARFYSVHILLLPGIMLGLVVAHLILVIYHKHTQYPGPGRTEKNVVGMPLLPVYMAKAGGFFFLVFGAIAAIAAIATINPIWEIGPYRPDQVSTGAQPDWYMGFAEGLIRVMPGWEINIWGHTLVLGVFIPLVIFPLVLFAIAFWPFLEAWATGDKREHHLLDRPRNAPTRTAFGVAWIAAYFVMLVGGGNDLWATHFHLSLNAITWFVRIGFFVVPVLSFIATRRICMGLQRRDREKVLHGRESGIIKRLPHGEFVEVHEPLTQEQLHTLTAHEQPKPLELEPEVDKNGVARKASMGQKMKVRLSKSMYGEDKFVPKATAEEYQEITSGHGHH
ncbi:cytochrome bc complex cytochrome b subunit [Streptomyces mobaraensis NBRC 13819 = DSM 40847]|uniref:Cytochrome bc1 complex cytochrome b subunit n=2 Tax=Streptomyces mobaraensis TaxID=35621 RepID=A0A5N5W587_STRMB|nr:cytochrome bc complex cytochrome b subunit [Streptomyces mobaraensis]EME96880.1 cytochrome subunit beta [Streptomyces mobaraensis NBRC 13819 = DSM 40847]KAB7842582.1 cytochrome bc complex cytochrome b subunit [Streptomyces mobaraensis]QTT73457.1 cytochrome bc complex cytochrome b subunit [Streptomyces mobaraensis NBRC 13819 = DSM 40847]